MKAAKTRLPCTSDGRSAFVLCVGGVYRKLARTHLATACPACASPSSILPPDWENREVLMWVRGRRVKSSEKYLWDFKVSNIDFMDIIAKPN